MRKIVFFTLVLCSAICFGQNDALFEKGNSAYAEGNYEEAVTAYSKILDNGEVSGALYYNLANAHYKLNHIAPSIYYYEKALELKPNDADVQNNIQFARNMALDDIGEIEHTGIRKSINDLIATFSYESWSKMAIGFMFLFVLSFLLYYYGRSSMLKRILFGLAVVAVLCSVTSVVFAYSQQNIQQDNNFAIIFSEEAPVRSEPNLRGEPSFLLHEGTKAKLLENYQQWYKIEIADGKQGWIKKEELKVL